MSKIIVSYRRSDSAAIAGRISDQLCRQFGDESVFMDVDGVPFGADFRHHIHKIVVTGSVMLVLIGRDWLGRNPDGGSRINDADDPVRVEIETALKHGLPLIPVLIDGARMPAAAELPAALHDFAYINAAPVDIGRDFRQHINRLISSVEAILAVREKCIFSPLRFVRSIIGYSTAPRQRARVAWLLALALVAAGTGVAFKVFTSGLTTPTPDLKPKFEIAGYPAVPYPHSTGRVTDETGYLADETQIRLAQRLADLHGTSSVQVVVALLREMPQSMQSEFGQELARRWQVGGDRQNGALLTLYPRQRQATLSVGSGAPDPLKTKAHLIIERVNDKLRAVDVVGGLMRGVDDIAVVLSGNSQSVQERFATTTGGPQPVAPATPAALIYRVQLNVSGGVQHLRSGPAVTYGILTSIPEGSSGITVGICRNSEDGTKPWCAANWRAYSGWISSCCIRNETNGAPPPPPAE